MIRHEILLFAGLREAARRDAITIELPADARVRDLLAAVAREHPELAAGLPPCRVAIDQTFADQEAPVPEGSEIALIPPVSGGHEGFPRALLTRAPLRLEHVVNAVSHANAGGIATFTGNVRRHSRGRDIEYLDYDAYEPMAVRAIQTIIARIEDHTEGTRVAIHHRVGRLDIGEAAVVIAASAPHREEAFAACRAAIEALKEEVPIWKKEVGHDGSVWIGQGP